jgi:hypothetical protein
MKGEKMDLYDHESPGRCDLGVPAFRSVAGSIWN